MMVLTMVIEDIFKALGDPTRLRIARLLGTMELAVGELAQVLGQSQPRVSRHVGILPSAAVRAAGSSCDRPRLRPERHL
jgi:DNA-binding transcriptional ArsR family regulator